MDLLPYVLVRRHCLPLRSILPPLLLLWEMLATAAGLQLLDVVLQGVEVLALFLEFVLEFGQTAREGLLAKAAVA